VSQTTQAGGLFVSYRPFLEGARGGVQICTREYLDVIGAAGVELTLTPFDGDRRVSTRLLRQTDSSPYLRPFEKPLLDRVRALAADVKPAFVFLNQVSIAALAAQIRPWLPDDCRIVLLSHGMEITDLLHLVRLRDRLPLSGRLRPTARQLLGKVLTDETTSRRDIDLVCALSSFDADGETWIGATRAAWLPRIVRGEPLAWRPTTGRFGYVGTLDHAPNLEGLVAVLEALARTAPEAVRLRIIGGPAGIGQWLKDRFASVDYLGALDDVSLAAEAATWNAMLHPIFCSARGCSTKLAQAIAWRIPIVTTPQGRRGYVWSHGSLIETPDADGFAARCLALLDSRTATAAQQDVTRVAASSPGLAEVAARMAELLELPAPCTRPARLLAAAAQS
jgi:hypothetical protein